MNRMDVAHLFRWVYPSQRSHQQIKKWVSVGRYWVCTSWSENLKISRFSKIRDGYFGKIDLKWGVVARFGLKMGGNEAHKVQDHF